MQDFPTSTTSHPLHEILDQIEEGVALMSAKKYNQASLPLTQALQKNKETLLSAMEDSQRNDEERLCEESSSWLPSQLLSYVITRSSSIVSLEGRIDESPLIRDDNNNRENHTDRSIYVYSTPLVVRTCDEESELFRNTPSYEIQTILSLIIIFNLALSNHLYAIDQMRKGCPFAKGKRLLSRAYSLYEHCKALQYQLKLESCWFFSLMIINNEAHVLSVIGEHKEAEELLRGILSGLCCLNRHYREENNHSLPPIASLEGFSHNTSYLILKDAITAAAA